MLKNLYSKLQPTKENIANEWANLSKLEQKSNLYSIASIPFKLSFLKITSLNMTEEEYKNRFNLNNRNISYIDNMNKIVNGELEVHPMDILAISEHERWNVFEISQSVLPMKKALVEKLKASKNENEIYHANISTEKGLLEYYADSIIRTQYKMITTQCKKL